MQKHFLIIISMVLFGCDAPVDPPEPFGVLLEMNFEGDSTTALQGWNSRFAEGLNALDISSDTWTGGGAHSLRLHSDTGEGSLLYYPIPITRSYSHRRFVLEFWNKSQAESNSGIVALEFHTSADTLSTLWYEIKSEWTRQSVSLELETAPGDTAYVLLFQMGWDPLVATPRQFWIDDIVLRMEQISGGS